MTNHPPTAPQNDHSGEPENDPTGTIRRLANGALVVKRDRSLRTGMLWLAVIRPEGMTNGVLFDDELGPSEVVGAMPSTPAADLAEDPVTAKLAELIEQAHENRRIGWAENRGDDFARHWGAVAGFLRRQLPEDHPLAYKTGSADSDEDGE